MSTMEEAVKFGGDMGGKYLESIGKYDLSSLSKEEWLTFVELVCRNYHIKLVTPDNDILDDDIPFSSVGQ